MRAKLLQRHRGANQPGMNPSSYVVRVARNAADLVPRFMKTRRSELPAMKAAIAARDFERLRKIGYRMRGIGGSYGFDAVSTLGRRIEESAEAKDLAALRRHLSEYRGYLLSVDIVYE